MNSAAEANAAEANAARANVTATVAAEASLLAEIDARQNELLDELERLNSRIEQVLQECLAWRGPEAPALPAAA
jgi:hypothetical protein